MRILHSSFLSAGKHDSCKASLLLQESFLEWSCQHVPLPSTFKWSQAASFNFSFYRKCSCSWILGSRRSGKLIRCFVPMASQFQHEMRIVSLINDAQIVERAAVVVTKSRFNWFQSRCGSRMRFSRYANTAEAVELEEAALPRERRPPMRHIVGRHLH